VNAHQHISVKTIYSVICAGTPEIQTEIIKHIFVV